MMSKSQTEGKLTVKNKPNYGINSLENTLWLTFLKKIPGCQKRGVADSPSSQHRIYYCFFKDTADQELLQKFSSLFKAELVVKGRLKVILLLQVSSHDFEPNIIIFF